MGSFVELNLAFTFLPETPPVVLAAFAPYRTEGAPVLPTLEELLGEENYERLELELEDSFSEEEFEELPLMSRAVVWRTLVNFGGNAYIPGPTYATMHWDPEDEVWSLATRTMPKSSREEVLGIVAPLGLFASDGTPWEPTEVGSVADEDGTAISIWSVGGAPFRSD